MKRKVKALALALALFTVTGCNSDKEVYNNSIKAGQNQIVEASKTKVAHVEAPRPKNIELNEEDNRHYLIPQTRELRKQETKEEASKDEKEVEEVEVEKITEKELEEVTDNQERALEEVELESYDTQQELATETEEYYLEENFKNEEDFEDTEENLLAFNDQYEDCAYDLKEVKVDNALSDDTDIVPSTSESSSLSNTVEQVVSSPQLEEIEASESDEVTSGLTITSPSEKEVKSYWKNYQSQAANQADFFGLSLVNPESEDIFAANPNTEENNLEIGELSRQAQLDALHIANTARFASGITNELTLGDEQAKFAQAATMINRLNLQIDHFPSLPNGIDANSKVYLDGLNGAKNSNLSSQLNLLESVVEYLRDDLGSHNQLEVGHRRWVLNPQSSDIGFGQTDEFNAMFVNNDDYDGENANTVYAYPSETAISEFHSQDAPLSLMFGENFDISNAQVEVKDLATGEINNQVHVDQSFKGNVKAITFGYGMNYQPGTKLQVVVNGVSKDGVEYPVEYTINYISIR